MFFTNTNISKSNLILVIFYKSQFKFPWSNRGGLSVLTVHSVGLLSTIIVL